MEMGNSESRRVCLRLWTLAHGLRVRWRKTVRSEPRRLWSRRAGHRYDGLNCRRTSIANGPESSGVKVRV